MARKTLVLSTGNIVSGGPSIIRKPGAYRSNLELTNSLRSNFLAAKLESAYQQQPASGASGSSRAKVNGHDTSFPTESPPPKASPASATSTMTMMTTTTTTTTKSPVPLSSWTSCDSESLYLPAIAWEAPRGLLEDASHYDITVKLFFLPTSDVASRPRYARDALSLVLRELRVPSVSLLIVSFPGMTFEGGCEYEADRANGAQGDDAAELATWAEAVEPLHARGLVRRLGIAEFGSEKLARFLARVAVAPAVDQINIRDCCSVPPPLMRLAKDKGIELFVHSDCTDVLPKGTLRELLGHGPRGAGVLADPAEGDDDDDDDGLRGDLTPLWVVKYTAVVRDRAVIENKGYFAGAELVEEPRD